MAFVRLLKDLIKDENIGARFVPIAPDEYRTFGMDSLFPTSKIYSPHGQTYDAVDRKLLLSYKEAESGQMLHEGISEAGSMASTIAAATAYATHGEHMIPVYIFYSMFGFQRTGDQMWALGDQMGRGFLLGATAGRTTLTGEGLQHADGHSPLLAASNPACVHYDPTWAFELAHIVKDALRRMYGSSEEHPNGEDVFYYLTVYNEPYQQPAEPENLDVDGLLKGLYRHRAAPEVSSGNGQAPRAQILASGVGGRWALEAQRLLAEDWGVAADVWSATSWNELAREARECDDWNLLNPDAEQRVPYVSRTLDNVAGPIVAVSDYMRAVPDQIAPWVHGDYTSLGTDGFGFSDTRAAARRFFNVDAASIVLAVLTRLARHGEVKPETLAEAIQRYQLNSAVSDVFAGGVGSAESNTGGDA
jgi:pyruvate dehydrogenase E1 component